MAESSVAIVTGGASGIGREYAVALLKRGWCVTIIDLKGAEITANELAEQMGGNTITRIIGVEGDVTDVDTMRDLFSRTKSHFGSFDLLVNNAAIAPFFFTDLTRVVAVNLIAVIQATETAVRLATDSLRCRSSRPFLIVNTASCAGLFPVDSDMIPVYTATKYGVVGFTRSLKYLGPKFNVRVNCICPVSVLTPLMGIIDTELQAFLDTESRGGVMHPQMCADALLTIIDNDNIFGEVVTVHPSVGHKVETLDPSGQFDYLGKWSYHKSAQVDHYVDVGLEKIKSGSGWSS